MKPNLIKVCGLTLPENVEAVGSLGVDLLGFIFYPPSTRYVVGKAAPDELIRAAGRVKKVGVFVDHPVNEIQKIAHTYQLDVVQLHGNESPETCATLRKFYQVIKAFPIAEPADFELTAPYEGTCDYFLFDTKGPKHGGNGVSFDWDLLHAYQGETPFLLSGGIGPDDADKIGTVTHPKMAGLDLNSRFESDPGIKQIDLLQAFLESITPN